MTDDERNTLRQEIEARGWDVVEENDDEDRPVLAVRDSRYGRLWVRSRYEAEQSGFVLPRR